MREIKFRAWDKERENMVHQGSNTNKNNGWILGQFIFDELSPGLIVTPYGEENAIDIMKFELMQYTGLKDKNGKEIYEGDILQDARKRKFVVTFNSGIGSWVNKPITKNTTSYPCFNFGSVRGLEVIGNTFENPELLGVIK